MYLVMLCVFIQNFKPLIFLIVSTAFFSNNTFDYGIGFRHGKGISFFYKAGMVFLGWKTACQQSFFKARNKWKFGGVQCWGFF